MTVSTQVSEVSHDCDGVSTLFPISFYFLKDTDLTVSLVNKTTGDSALLALGTDFTVSGAGDQSGGALRTIGAPRPAGYRILIELTPPATQETSYQANDPFPAKSHERALDKLTMLIQRVLTLVGWNNPALSRVLMLGRGDVSGQGAYRANQNRIRDLGDPMQSQDAVNLRTLQKAVAEFVTDGGGNALLALFANASDPNLGVSLIGGASRVVNAISALRALPKNGSPRALVLGYYLPGDGGGGEYWLDPTDTATSENGGTVIVAEDGGRWKLVLRTRPSVRQFGARGDGVSDDTASFMAAAAASSSGIEVPDGDYLVRTHLQAPLFLSKGAFVRNDTGTITTADGRFIDNRRREPVFESNVPWLYGRRANQIFQLAAPTLPAGVSGVSQGLMVDEENDIYYMTWDDGSQNVIFRKFDAAGKTLSEFMINDLGHGDSISKATWNGNTVYLMAGSGPTEGKVHIIQNDALAGSVDVNLEGRVGGALIAVDQYAGDKCAFFYRTASGEMRISHSISLADVMAGTAASQRKNTFTFSLPEDPGIAAVDMQSLGYYNGDILVWAGNDSRSGQKLLIRYDRFGQVIEQMNVAVDRQFADIEGTITEPEGMSVSHNPITGACDIHLTKCFGTHASSGTIIRVYELAYGESDNAVFVEGMPEREGVGQPHQLRIVDIPIIFEKVTGGWAPNVGSVIASTGKMGANNVRVDVGGQLGLYFDLYKPYITLLGFNLSQSAGLTSARILASWTINKGGSSSNKDHRITFFNVNTNSFVSANDAAIGNGASVCLTLRVGFHR